MKLTTIVRATLASTMALVCLALPASVALADDLPGGTTTRYLSRFDVPNPPSQFDVIEVVLDFAPGAWTPTHSHGGLTLSTVIAGELTWRQDGKDTVVKAGQTWVDQAGAVHAAGNNGTTIASVVTTVLLPKDAKVTTNVATEPPVASGQAFVTGPTTRYVHTFAVASPTPPFQAVQAVVDTAPGSWTPTHVHGGMLLHMMIAGELTWREHGIETVVKAGGTHVDQAGEVHAAGNTGSVVSTDFATFLVAPGVPLTTNVAAASLAQVPAAMPRTGEGGATTWNLLLALGLGTGLVAGSWSAQRRRLS